MLRFSLLGAAAVTEALAFNAAFAGLGASFDYPGILRHPAAEVLAAFADGGPALILIWYGFALTSLAFIPLALGLALKDRPVLALPVAAAILGALAGLAQAIGLLRWTFVIPSLAAHPGADADLAFMLLNQYGGVAIGEHLGQMLTAGFLATMALIGFAEGARIRAAIAAASAAAILIGTGEGLMLALGRDTGPLPLFAVAGYLGLSLWLAAEGLARLRRPAPAATLAAA